MSVISLDKTALVIPEFIQSRLMPGAPGHVQFLLGALTPSIVQAANTWLSGNIQTLKGLGLADENGRLDLEKVKGAISSGFASRADFWLGGFKFTKDDGDALAAIIEKYKEG